MSLATPVSTAATIQPSVCYHDVDALLSSLVRHLDGPPWSDPTIASLLDSLVLHLEAHLETVLEGGFAPLVHEDPRLAAPVEALLREAKSQLFRARELADRARRQARLRTTWIAMGRAVRELHRAVERQEAAERELLNEAYQRDIGARD